MGALNIAEADEISGEDLEAAGTMLDDLRAGRHYQKQVQQFVGLLHGPCCRRGRPGELVAHQGRGSLNPPGGAR